MQSRLREGWGDFMESCRLKEGLTLQTINTDDNSQDTTFKPQFSFRRGHGNLY